MMSCLMDYGISMTGGWNDFCISMYAVCQSLNYRDILSASACFRMFCDVWQQLSCWFCG